MNAPPVQVRIDKWLWAVRIFKTRSLATKACRDGKVTVEGQPAKASREVAPGQIIVAKTGEVIRTVKVLGLLHQRVGAEAAKQFMEDLTPASEYEKKRERSFIPVFHRPKGAGRPTKKDRRKITQAWDRTEPG